MFNANPLFRALTLISVFGCILAFSNVLHGQDFEQNRPTARAIELLVRPDIDGEVLEDPVWQGIAPFGDLIQTQPAFGAAASRPMPGAEKPPRAYLQQTGRLAKYPYPSGTGAEKRSRSQPQPPG